MKRLILLPVVVLCALPLMATTYYVSKSTGSDSNNSTQAQSKSTPWAHLPGMAGATSSAKSYSPVAGDQFIMMGCDVWGNSDLPVDWEASGSSSSPIYIGADKTWYNTSNCPSAWNRPVWDAQKSCWSGAQGNVMLVLGFVNNSVSYVTFDNIEMRGLEIKSSCAGGNGNGDYIQYYNPVTNTTLSNLYIHAWDSSVDNCIIVQAQAGSNTFTTGVIDGTDGTGVAAKESCYGFYPTPPDHITNSVLNNLVNPIVGYAGTGSGGTPPPMFWSGNTIVNQNDSYQGANHGNMIETVGGGTYYIYNNYMSNATCGGCESMMIGNPNETDYVFNNVIFNLGGSVSGGGAEQTPSLPQGSASNWTSYFWNNTIVATDDQSCTNNSGQGNSTLVYTQNTHCIQGETGGAVTDFNLVSPNLSELNGPTSGQSCSTSGCADYNSSPHFDQYTSTQTYAYSPVASTNSTVGAGANLTSTCNGNSNLTPLCSDITFYSEQTISGVVVAAIARTANTRPSTGAWDIGAYLYNGQDPPPPAPPTGLTAVVN